MNYPTSVHDLQQLFQGTLPLSNQQIRRISILCFALLITKKVYLSFIARVLPQKKEANQDSRIRFISRLLTSDFMKIDKVYHPFLKIAISKLNLYTWNLAIDRTSFIPMKKDLLIISLIYYKHAIPLVWCEVPYGGAPLITAIQLLKQCPGLLPPNASVLFHGDTEFSGHPMVEALEKLKWDFILAQPSSTHIWKAGADSSIALGDLSVGKAGLKIANIKLWSENPRGDYNLVAYNHTKKDSYGHTKSKVTYLVTSLPPSERIKRLGRRRWGVEAMHKDFKSGGLEITDTHIRSEKRRAGLLIMLALVYLLTISMGRRLCQTGERHQVDSKRQRQLSLFRLGWDFIVHKLTTGQSIHIPLRLST